MLDDQSVVRIAAECGEPRASCGRILQASLFEWQRINQADNVTVIVVQFGDDAVAETLGTTKKEIDLVAETEVVADRVTSPHAAG